MTLDLQKAVIKMYVVAARFSTKTWDEQCAYYAKKKIAGCVYGSPQPMAKSIPYGAPVFVLEMNLSTRRIMGVGLVANDYTVGIHHIYSDTQYNVCAYDGKYRVDREEMTAEEEAIMVVFDEELFWKSHVWRSSNGLRHIPKRVCELPGFNYEIVLRDMFVRRFAKTKPKAAKVQKSTARA